MVYKLYVMIESPDKDTLTCANVRYEGRVQGVGFRVSTKQLADEEGVAGSVRNEMDGSVTLLAVGSHHQVTSLLNRISASRLGRYILNRHMEWSHNVPACTHFRIEY